ncbi:MAG: transglutaminase domain-containing protein [Anaerolineales bacterium]|nr:transglutaminase domain-containing protein [Anaerolineales bacterium]
MFTLYSSKTENKSPNRNRWWDALSAVLLLAALITAGLRLDATDWTEDLEVVETTVLLGGILGMVLGYSRFSHRVSGLLAFLYGCYVIPWQLGVSLWAGMHTAWEERLLSMFGRLEMVVSALLTRKPITDNILFLFLMACLFWALGLFAGYLLTRHGHSWWVVLPGGLVVLIIHSFDSLLVRRTWYLAFYLFFSLLLIARINYLKNVRHWEKEHMHLPADAGFDWIRFTTLLAMAFVLLAWNTPVLVGRFDPAARLWQSVSQPWIDFKERMSYAFAALQAEVGFVVDYYDETLALGSGNLLTNEIILEITAPRIPAVSRYYWRGRVYGYYDGEQWFANLKAPYLLGPEQLDLELPGSDVRRVGEFTFLPRYAISILYVAPQPLWISRPSQGAVGYGTGGEVDLVSIEADEYIRAGEVYTVRSSLSTVTINQLREAGSEYPDWVLQRYLQLPDTITPRTIELANSIAEGLDNPYDITEAVTAYLRKNIEYAETVPQAPPDQDRVDWFLFDLQRGFCNYSASAEVVLLRALGIPARIAVGFAQGEKIGSDASGDHYIIRQRNAHAWPEVYFPNIGWVEFEPTSGQEELVRPRGADRQEGDPYANIPRDIPQMEDIVPPEGMDTLDDDVSQPTQEITVMQVVRLAIWLLGLLLVGYVYWRVRNGARVLPFMEKLVITAPVRMEQVLMRLGIKPPAFLSDLASYASLPPLSRAYQEINRALHRLGEKPLFPDTPAERAGKLAALLPEAIAPTNVLLEEYHKETYSHRAGDLHAAQQAGHEIRRLSRRERAKRWIDKLKRAFENLG